MFMVHCVTVVLQRKFKKFCFSQRFIVECHPASRHSGRQKMLLRIGKKAVMSNQSVQQTALARISLYRSTTERNLFENRARRIISIDAKADGIAGV